MADEEVVILEDDEGSSNEDLEEITELGLEGEKRDETHEEKKSPKHLKKRFKSEKDSLLAQ